MNPIFYIDFYKAGHINQYHNDVTQVFSNWTPRFSRVPDVDHVIPFGLTYFLKKYLIDEFEQHFFSRPLHAVLDEYRELIKATLFIDSLRTDHIEALHRKGHIPLTFYALPEGAPVPINVPPIIVKNTEPGEFFWLPNYFETLMSNILNLMPGSHKVQLYSAFAALTDPANPPKSRMQSVIDRHAV